MKKIITTIALGIFLLTMVSAMNLYSGECTSIELIGLENTEDIIYLVVGNSSNTEGMTLTNNGSSIEVCFDLLYESDNFTLAFMDKVTKEVIKEVKVYSGGGGGSRTKYVENKTYVEVPNYISVYENITKEVPVETTNEIEEIEGIWKGWKVLGILAGIAFILLGILMWWREH